MCPARRVQPAGDGTAPVFYVLTSCGEVGERGGVGVGAGPCLDAGDLGLDRGGLLLFELAEGGVNGGAFGEQEPTLSPKVIAGRLIESDSKIRSLLKEST